MSQFVSPIAALLFSLALSATAWALTPQQFQGKPESFAPKAVDGAAVWQDGKQLKVRFTTPGKSQTFRGRVCSPEGIQGLVPHQLESTDSAKVGPKGKCIWFKFVTSGQIDGFDFNAPTKRDVIFDFKTGTKQMARTQLDAKRILIGASNAHPKHNPFTWKSNP